MLQDILSTFLGGLVVGLFQQLVVLLELVVGSCDVLSLLAFSVHVLDILLLQALHFALAVVQLAL